MECESCAYYAYDEDDDEYYCTAEIDQDDAWRMTEHKHQRCPWWRNGDEYSVVKHQA